MVGKNKCRLAGRIIISGVGVLVGVAMKIGVGVNVGLRVRVAVGVNVKVGRIMVFVKADEVTHSGKAPPGRPLIRLPLCP